MKCRQNQLGKTRRADGKKRKVSFGNVTPSDPSFLIAQESGESVFPPAMLENEQLALKRST